MGSIVFTNILQLFFKFFVIHRGLSPEITCNVFAPMTNGRYNLRNKNEMETPFLLR